MNIAEYAGLMEEKRIVFSQQAKEEIKQMKRVCIELFETLGDEGNILFSEMLTDFERIGDHALNIANELLKMAIIEK